MREIDNIGKIKEQFIAYLTFEKGLSRNSVEAYTDDTEKLIRYLEEDGKKLSDITESDLHEFLSTLHDLGISPRSQARIISGIRAFFHFLSFRPAKQHNSTQNQLHFFSSKDGWPCPNPLPAEYYFPHLQQLGPVEPLPLLIFSQIFWESFRFAFIHAIL